MNKENSDEIINAVMPLSGALSAESVSVIEKTLSEIPGISAVSANIASSSVLLSYKSSAVSPEDIKKKLADTGFDVLAFSAISPEQQNFSYDESGKASSRIFLRFLLALGLFAAMLIGEKLHFSGFTFGMLALLAWGIAGWHFHKGFFYALKKKRPDSDMLVSMSSSAVLFYGLAVTLFPNMSSPYSPHWYDAAMLIAFMNFGRWAELRYKTSASEALDKLLRITPAFACRRGERGEETILVKEVKKGDTILIRPNQQIPVDGKVINGLSSVDESLLTGEAVPSSKSPGSHVYAGTFNQTGRLELTAEKIGDETMIMGIARSVQSSRSWKKTVLRTADRICSWYVPSVIFIALVAAIVWIILSWDFSMALGVFSAVLAVSCPCAMGLALPMAVSIGFRRAVSLGIIIKNTHILNNVGLADTVIFDKTGTLTDGTLVLKSIHPHGIAEDKLLELMALAEDKSMHPFAVAVRRAAAEKNFFTEGVLSFTAYPGRGVKASCAQGNIIAGSLKWFDQEKIAIPPEVRSEMDSSPESLLLLALNGDFKGYALFGGHLRPNALGIVKTLRGMGIESVLASGDRLPAVEAVARETSIKVFHSGVFPDDKRNIVRRYMALGKHTIMVGDGFNDAPALSAADIGISLRSGADIAVAASDIALAGNDLQYVADAMLALKRIKSIIRQNIILSFAYNAALIPLAAGIFYPISGIVIPPQCSLAVMALGSASVAINSLRLKGMKLKKVL